MSEMSPNNVTILGVSLNSTSRQRVLEEIVNFEANQARLPAGRQSLLVFTPNPEFLVEADKDENFKEILNKGDINLPDGVGIILAGKLLATPIRERVSGADVVGDLLAYGNCRGKWTIGIVGARRAVLEESTELVKRLQQKYPNVNFVNLDQLEINSKHEIRNTKQIQNSKSKIQNVSDFDIRISDFNVVFACYGMKKQEEWIMENKDRVSATVFMGIGGSLDFITGFTKRAPSFIRQVGLEWLWRGLQRPSHFKRVWKATVVFSWLVLKERFKF
ncbi:hypothetical protein COT64_00935 [Candidatus Shapirobacteria bacterium CG09_land_8_20_14_0_10_39_12]|uniref:Glycosyltransferase n=1 Tax=Candidatus Shapirobacteria bacterium CG09_land_8_20_14_0_10_39_12 TaxID=1974885 RepID=A0A2H0WS47_9BACT|nr:MAG: hypothetical protein COT64_00935 [Candidatus Shapirobacteria bacterium CG09_land_8_20_14_0_10_39_12]